ncbi:MAG TPA: hypothetical protein VJ044_00545 [Candidatus Hodarchaeales archaeon]|nr:hypothetical protein [Candidatus Hodarchaeales archaeon]
MLKVKDIRAFIKDKDDDMDFDFIVTAIEWVVKSPEAPEEAVADEIAD